MAALGRKADIGPMSSGLYWIRRNISGSNNLLI
jgi:hypothetical protein